MKKPRKVRYITLSRYALQIIATLSDEENGLFNRILWSCYRQLENGQELDYEKTGNNLLDIALEDAIEELQEGYKTYMQRVNAASKKSSAQDQPIISEQSMIDQRTVIEENEKKKKNEMNEESILEGNARGRPFDEIERFAIDKALSNAGIAPDRPFWVFAEKVGSRITLDAINQAKDLRSHDLKYVVHQMKEKMKEAIS